MAVSGNGPRVILVVMALMFTVSLGFLTVLRSEIREKSEIVVARDEQILRITERLASFSLVDGANLDTSLVWGTTAEATAGQSMQSWLLGKVRANDQTVRQYQQGARAAVGSMSSVEFRLEFTGSLGGLAALLDEIEHHRPALAISNLQLRPLALREQRDGSTLVATQLTVWGVTDAVVN
jgi:hypothetical protein